MKKVLLVLGFTAMLAVGIIGCHSATTDVVAVANDTTKVVQPSKDLIQDKDTFHRDVDTFAVGDVNGDGKMDTAYLTGPYYKEMDCKDTCLSTITFSSGIATLKLGDNIGGRFYAQTDVNDDGRGEILFIPDWFTSCWAGLYVYSYQGNTWKNLGTASVYHCADSVNLDRVKKAGKGYISLRDDAWDDEGNMKAVWRKIKLQ